MDLSLFNGNPALVPISTPLKAYAPVYAITGGAITGHTDQSSWSQDVYFMDLEISFSGGTGTGTITNFVIPLPTNPLTGTPFTIGGPTGARYMGGGIDGFSLLTNRFDGTVQGVQGDTNITVNLDAGNSFAAAGSGKSLRASIRLPIVEFLSTAYAVVGAGVSDVLNSLVKGGYEETTHVSNFSGPFAATARTIEIIRVGRLVTLTFPEIRVTGNNAAGVIAMATPLPVKFRPVTQVFAPILVSDNSVDQNVNGWIALNANGTINLNKTLASSNFSASTGTTGSYPFSLSYKTAP